MQPQMIIAQAVEQNVMMDLGYRLMDTCWDVCYDKNLTKTELMADDGITEQKLKKMKDCSSKCIQRHFEVMKLNNEAREIREKEMMMGLAPGTLSEKK